MKTRKNGKKKTKNMAKPNQNTQKLKNEKTKDVQKMKKSKKKKSTDTKSPKMRKKKKKQDMKIQKKNENGPAGKRGDFTELMPCLPVDTLRGLFLPPEETLSETPLGKSCLFISMAATKPSK